MHLNILARRSLWTEESGGPQSMCHKKLDTTERLTFTLHFWWIVWGFIHSQSCDLWIYVLTWSLELSFSSLDEGILNSFCSIITNWKLLIQTTSASKGICWTVPISFIHQKPEVTPVRWQSLNVLCRNQNCMMWPASVVYSRM